MPEFAQQSDSVPHTQTVRVKRILIVDDDSRIRGIVRKNLEDRDWACEEAINGIDGISKARAFKPDLVILDVSMPLMNGFDAAVVLNREMPTVPLVMLTMYGDVLKKSNARPFEVKAIIGKADGIAALVSCIQGLLTHS